MFGRIRKANKQHRKPVATKSASGMVAITEEQKSAFVDRLQVELDGQELMFDKHEWLTLVLCIRRALDDE